MRKPTRQMQARPWQGEVKSTSTSESTAASTPEPVRGKELEEVVTCISYNFLHSSLGLPPDGDGHLTFCPSGYAWPSAPLDMPTSSETSLRTHLPPPAPCPAPSLHSQVAVCPECGLPIGWGQRPQPDPSWRHQAKTLLVLPLLWMSA